MKIQVSQIYTVSKCLAQVLCRATSSGLGLPGLLIPFIQCRKSTQVPPAPTHLDVDVSQALSLGDLQNSVFLSFS